MKNQYSFVWNKSFLAEYLNKFSDVYIFGGSGNIFDMFGDWLEQEPRKHNVPFIDASQTPMQILNTIGMR